MMPPLAALCPRDEALAWRCSKLPAPCWSPYLPSLLWNAFPILLGSRILRDPSQAGTLLSTPYQSVWYSNPPLLQVISDTQWLSKNIYMGKWKR